MDPKPIREREPKTMAGQIPTKGVQPKNSTPRKTPAKKAPVKTPGKVIAKVRDDKPKTLTLAQAEALTAAIKKADDNLATKIVASFTGRIWEAYGLKDWGEYAAQHLGEAQIIARAVRKTLVPQLAKARISNRAIAAGLGADEKTIRNDLAEHKKVENEVRNNSAPDAEPPLDVEITNMQNGSDNDEHAGMRLGADGKWQPENKPQQEPKAPDLVGAANKIAKALEAVRIRLGSLLDKAIDSEHQSAVDDALRQAVIDFHDEAGYLLPEPEPAV
ncbi:hypothetical protein [Mycobacterium avium]|jgi:hypothetical protein|uniref:hypothetical protein n=2 Tax=Mycobacterium avium TaxID=1764 RepID=UPI00040B7F89|nr:hypothetical protein [Mycobacterium avium]KBR62183.1 hypothetical protein X425_02736 [Mycobacterium avium XTB13-223]MCA4761375.1 hypothetical protein [Mycobacterium avium subsp. hominissuis]MDO2355762.1 hypothetical protein [Mycobacterium avium subsp. hominissuis]MDV3271675.1 hypothetical protein [Mycobacterium avium]